MHIKIENGITRHPDWRMAEPVNLEIQPGEQVAIIGDNAAGKSRLVEILTGHYPLLMNEVQYDFGPGAHRLVSENLRYISFRDSYGETDGTYYYQQRWNQHDIDEQTPTVADLIGKALSLSSAKEKEALTAKLVSLFHLENLLDKYIITLSSGELRKFQLTRALMGEPRAPGEPGTTGEPRGRRKNQEDDGRTRRTTEEPGGRWENQEDDGRTRRTMGEPGGRREN